MSASDPGGFFGSGGSGILGSGSGFIISTSGYILTNYHVIEEAYQRGLPLKVSVHDGTEYDATIIGFEASNDVAVVKIEATGLNAVTFANSDNIRVGQEVYAVGNPLGELPYTMTDGIVSALNRIVTVDNKVINTFQLTAAVNSGNSGGPVYNTNGEVIGIVSAKIMGGSVEGIGFAIPINDAEVIAAELIEHGYLTGRALIGITVQTVTSGHAEYYGWVEGVYIKTVNEGSAGDKAGLKVGDIITKLGGVDAKSTEALDQAKRKFRAGDTTTITVWRNGDTLELTITFDEDFSAGQPRVDD
jgi:serine protease Do